MAKRTRRCPMDSVEGMQEARRFQATRPQGWHNPSGCMQGQTGNRSLGLDVRYSEGGERVDTGWTGERRGRGVEREGMGGQSRRRWRPGVSWCRLHTLSFHDSDSMVRAGSAWPLGRHTATLLVKQ